MNEQCEKSMNEISDLDSKNYIIGVLYLFKFEPYKAYKLGISKSLTQCN